MSSETPKPDASKDDIKPPIMRLDAGRRDMDREVMINASRYTDACNSKTFKPAPRLAPKPAEKPPEKGK